MVYKYVTFFLPLVKGTAGKSRNMNIELQSKLFRLRSVLNSVSDASFAYKTLYSKYRIGDLSDTDAEKLIRAYEDIIKQVRNSIQNTEDEIPTARH